MPNAHRSAKRRVLSVLAAVGLLVAITGIVIHLQKTWHPAANPLSTSAMPTQTLSEEEITNILQHGTLVKATPSDNMRPDGYDSEVFEFKGARYVIHTGGLSGQHRYGTRLPNTK